MQLARSLCFGSDGTRAAIASDAGVHVVDLAGRRPPAFHPLAAIADLAAVGDELWVAAGREPRLFAFGADHQLRSERALWGGRGLLRACATGAVGALWSESPPQIVLAAGGTSAIALATDPECAIPISPTRWLVCQRGRAVLRDPSSERWSVALPGAPRVVDGAVLFGGRSIALLTAAGGALAQLVVLNLNDGKVVHKMTLTGIESVRFATARGLALLRSGPSTLVLVDLRFGELLKERREAQPIVDVAIDPGGTQYVARFGDTHDDVAIHSIVEWLAEASAPLVAGSASDAPVVADPDPEPQVEPEAKPEAGAGLRDPEPEIRDPDPVSASAPDLAPPDLGAPHVLAPIAPHDLASAAAAVALLDRYREVISALAGAAIAAAWDDGRLAEPTGGLPHHAEVAALRGRTRGLAADEVATANREVDAAFERAFAEERALGNARSPLAALAAELGLSPAGQLVLLAVAAPALWPEVARLYAVLGAGPGDLHSALPGGSAARSGGAGPGDLHSALPGGSAARSGGAGPGDLARIAAVLAARFDATAVARELERDAPLRVHRAIVGTAPLTCAPIVLARLRGREGSELHGELAPARVIGATRSFDDLQLATAVKHDILRRLADAPVGPRGRVVVRGRLGSGRHTLLATLAAAAGRTLAVIDAAALAPDRLADVLAAAQLAGALPCVDGLDRARDLRAVLDDHPGPLAIRLPWEADATAPPLPAGHVALELPPLTWAERIAAWNATAAAHGLAVADVAALADRFAVGPGGIELACATLAGRGLTPDDAAPALAAILRAQAEPVLRALATQIQPAPWSRVVVPADVHDSVRELIARIAHRRRATAWHHGGNDAERGVIALIHGAPGTGKTLVASTVAGELGLPLYRVEVARLAEPRAQLIALLDAADYAGAVIVLAEVDALLADRAALDALAVRLERCDGIVIITARAGAAVETALRRQLAFRFALLFPDEDAREQLWRLHVPRGAAIDLAQITQLGQRYALSGASIRAAATRAAFLALEEQTALGLDHLERAIRAEIRELTALSALAPAD